MNPWAEAASTLGIAIIIVLTAMAWMGLWITLNIKKQWSGWICYPAALLPVITGLYFLTYMAIIQR